jgi:hypothetical protein
MPRVKIFNETDTYTLECVINDWMREEPRIRIKAIRQSTSPIRTVVSVWYDEEEDLPKVRTPVTSRCVPETPTDISGHSSNPPPWPSHGRQVMS